MKFFEYTPLLFFERRIYRTLLVFNLVFLLTASSLAQKNILGENFNQDVEQTLRLLKENYPGIYHYRDSTYVNNTFKDLFINPLDSITILDSYHKLAGAIAELNDLHLSIGLPKKYFEKETKIFPFILRCFDQKFFVHYNQTADSTIVRGDEIISIDGVRPFDDFHKFISLYGADNANPQSKNYYAEVNFQGFYTRWYGLRDSVSVVYKHVDDSTLFTKNINFLLPREALENTTKRYINVLRKNFNLSEIDSVSKTYKLDITSFRGKNSLIKATENKFRKQLRRSFREIEQKNVQNLVLDFRGNGGGAVVNVQRLVSYLNFKPYQLYDTIFITKEGFRKVFKPWIGISTIIGKVMFNKKYPNGYFRSYSTSKSRYKPTRKYHFDKNLYVLMDGGSYSATTFAISLLKNRNRAIFVGTPPGGANWGSFAGQFYRKKLANSKLELNIPLMKLLHSTENEPYMYFFVQPDYYIKQSFEDFLKRKDTLVDFVKDITTNERN